MSRQLSQIKRLEGETQYYSERMAKLDSECSHFLVRVADLTEEKQSLETENLLVKYAKEAAVTSLATLQTDHEQVNYDVLFVIHCLMLSVDTEPVSFIRIRMQCFVCDPLHGAVSRY